MNLQFDYDFCLGRWMDDNEFIFRIKNVIRLNIINVDHTHNKLLGIHQHHDTVTLNSNQQEYNESIHLNKYIYKKKTQYFEKHKNWIYLCDDGHKNFNIVFGN